MQTIALSTQSLLSLENCLFHLRAWFCHNGLALNPDKTDVVLFGTRNQGFRLRRNGRIYVAKLAQCVQNLNVGRTRTSNNMVPTSVFITSCVHKLINSAVTAARSAPFLYGSQSLYA